jgi:hypothetical protein
MASASAASAAARVGNVTISTRAIWSAQRRLLWRWSRCTADSEMPT